MKKALIGLPVWLLATSIAYGQQGGVPRFINPPTVAPAKGYSQLVRVEMGTATLVLVSGQVPLDIEGKLVGAGNMEQQASQAFANIKALLEAAGGSMRDVVKLAVYTTDISQIQAVRKARDRYIDLAHPPASTAVEVRQLVRPEWLVEIEATAVIPHK